MTKISKILKERGIRQKDFINIIEDTTGIRFSRDRISRICTGKIKNYTIETAVILSSSLGVSIDDIVDNKRDKKNEKISNTRNIL
jgi:DNA-binding Xre family transcriptional regulator